MIPENILVTLVPILLQDVSMYLHAGSAQALSHLSSGVRLPKLGRPQNFKNLYYISPLLINSLIKFFFQHTGNNSPLKYTIKIFFQAHQQQPINTNSCPQLYSTLKIFFFSLYHTSLINSISEKKEKKRKKVTHQFNFRKKK